MNLITLPSSCSLGVSTPYLATFSEVVTLLEWLSGRLTPEMCDMARPTWLPDVDADGWTETADDDEDPPVLATKEVAEEEVASLALPRDAAEALAASESSTRKDGKSSSCCLSTIKK